MGLRFLLELESKRLAVGSKKEGGVQDDSCVFLVGWMRYFYEMRRIKDKEPNTQF